MTHQSVLLHEVIDLLSLQKGDTVLDATINGGGHSSVIADHIGPQGILIGIDLDEDALSEARLRLKDAPCKVILKEGNFSDFDQVLEQEDIPRIDKALFDLGLSSWQLDLSGRGFSFTRDEPLQMTFKRDPRSDREFTAENIVNSWSEEALSDVLYGYADERFAKRIARRIAEYRRTTPIQTTGELVLRIKEATPLWYHHGRTHFATRTFQALRIAVNSELENLKKTLPQILEALSPNGRVAVIAFHSIEDKIVKTQFRTWQKEKKGTLCTKKPVTPTHEEISANPRARSAKLRVFKKV